MPHWIASSLTLLAMTTAILRTTILILPAELTFGHRRID
jgi:hypothetical protein